MAHTAQTDLKNILDRVQDYLARQWKTLRESAVQNRIILSSLYCSVALFFLITFAITSFLQSHYGHAIVLLVISGLTVASYIYLRITGNNQITNNFIVLLLGVLCLFLLYTGGIGGTGPLWYYVFPLFALFVLKLWIGLLSVLMLFVITVFLFWFPVAGFDPSIYSQSFKERFLSVYVAVSVMAFIYAYVRMNAELKMDKMNKALKSIANTDELTQLANRRQMKETLAQEVGRTRRHQGVFSLIVMDIDFFKAINDQYGHDGGDAVLRSVREIVHTVLRTQDTCARWGGEEFLILLPETGLDGARQVAERLRMAFEKFRIKFLLFFGRRLAKISVLLIRSLPPEVKIILCIGPGAAA